MVTNINTPRYWDRTYERFEREGRVDEVAQHRENAWASVNRLLPPAGHLLDVGCGTGAFLQWLSERRPDLRLYGVDFSPHANEVALQRAPVATFQIMPADGLRFEDAEFDVVYSGHLLEHLSDPVAALREQIRVLRPGGLLIVHFPYGDPPYVEHVHHSITYDTVRLWLQAAEWTGDITITPVVTGKPTNDGITYGRKP